MSSAAPSRAKAFRAPRPGACVVVRIGSFMAFSCDGFSDHTPDGTGPVASRRACGPYPPVVRLRTEEMMRARTSSAGTIRGRDRPAPAVHSGWARRPSGSIPA